MRYAVLVRPNAKHPRVEESERGLVAHVDAPAVDGKANERLIELLAAHFGVKRWQLRMIRGSTGRKKIIEIGR